MSTKHKCCPYHNNIVIIVLMVIDNNISSGLAKAPNIHATTKTTITASNTGFVTILFYYLLCEHGFFHI